jgi:hypothetical protein
VQFIGENWEEFFLLRTELSHIKSRAVQSRLWRQTSYVLLKGWIDLMTVENHQMKKEAPNARAKVRFRLEEADAVMGVEAELLWAIPLRRGIFKLDSIPFYVYGISNEDIVSAVTEGAIFEFDEVVSRGGHSTYRVLINDAAGFESDSWIHHWPKLAALGCSFEIAKRRWIAIDVPGSSNVNAVYALLEQGVSEGIWSIDEGHCGHLA